MRSTLPATTLTALGLLAAACSTRIVPGGAATGPMEPRETVVSLTFDDGDADNFPSAAVLEEHGLRATWYVPSGLIGTPGYMTWEQLGALREQGHEIGGHSLQHVRIDGLPEAELRQQVCEDRQTFLDRGFAALSFAYPYGGYDDAARQMVQQCGYASARSIGAGPEAIPPGDAYRLRAYPYIVSDTRFGKLQRYVSGTRADGGGWLILIFHHVCDGCDYFSVGPDVLHRFIAWLGGEQEQGRVKVRTIGEIIAGGAP